jgi:hypothetical protein
MIRLGAYLRDLFAMRIVVIPALALACVVALVTAFKVSLAPPALALQAVTVVGAHTQILVDGPKPGILATTSGVTSYDVLRDGALLLGNIMTSDPGADYVARSAKLPIGDIAFSDPQSYFPSATSAASSSRTPKYTLTVAADPSVPLLDVYGTAPTRSEALRLVNAAFTGLRTYLSGPGATGTYQLRITQLGHGLVVETSGGPPITSALLRFIAVFAFCAVVGRLLRRSLLVWRLNRQTWLMLSRS